MKKSYLKSVLFKRYGVFTVSILCVFSSATYAISPDPVQQLVTPNPVISKLKSSPVFEGRGDGVTICPVTGEKITTKAYTYKFNGRNVYFCCKGCLQSAKHQPDRFIKPTLAEQQASVKAYVAKMPIAPSGEDFCNE